ncbi:MAG: phosphatidylglycerophosphatase A [Helicobacteraceae bacterium 4484_230]|nr:MAG: phosphatidylglycerophosphatase A [Helicobacteraceae bacterium 4484_230]
MKFNKFFITVGYSGLSPVAPGTMGSLVSLVPGVFILSILGPQTLFMATLLAILIGIREIDKYEAVSKTHDDKQIVIDELAGMWLALSIAPGILTPFAELFKWENGMMIQIALSFVLFRAYDIKKPSIIGRIDREAKGGIGVMGDDILAGIAAGITTALIWQAVLALGLF